MATNSPTPSGVPAPPSNPKQVRLDAELSRVALCGRVPCSELTMRIYETAREGVSPKMRRRLDAVYAELAAQVPPR